jgi:excisionase family DNA binding protein
VNGNTVSTEAAMVSVDIGMRPLLVDAKQAARLLGIGRTTLYELIKAGAVTAVHIGRCVRFSVTELERFVESGCVADLDAEQQAAAPVQAPSRRTARRSAGTPAAPSLFDVAS